MNYTSMNGDRLRFLYAIHHNKQPDFGVMVYDQLLRMADTAFDAKKRIGFPSLIQQLLSFQRLVPRHENDEDLTGHPTALVKDGKAGRGSGGVRKPPNLADDLQKVIDELRTIQLRSRSKFLFILVAILFKSCGFYLIVHSSRGRIC